MNLARLILPLALAAAPTLLQAQPPAAGTPAAISPAKLPAFEVISVKPNNSAAHQVTLNYAPDGLRATNVPAFFLLREAFGLNQDQIFGAPGWLQSTSYDIEAKVNSSDVDALKALSQDQRRQMIVQILTERFHLTFHCETRMLPEYALVVAKGGSKLKEFQPGNDAAGQPKHTTMNMHDGLITAQGIPLGPFIHFLSDRLGHPIEDKTGLTGSYDFTLQMADEHHDGPARGPDAGSSAASDSTAPSIFTAIQEQLGLRLESEKGPVEVLIIDHIDQPTQN